jgi:hypothetical protein
MPRKSPDISHFSLKEQETILKRRAKDKMRNDRNTLRSRELRRIEDNGERQLTEEEVHFLSVRSSSKRKYALKPENRERVRAYSLKRLEDPIKRARNLETSKAHREANRDYYSKYMAAWSKRREAVDPSFKIGRRLRTLLSNALQGRGKLGSAVGDLGCTLEELKAHLEVHFTDGMTWETYGTHGWHIDHIIPLASFDLTDREQFLKACHFSNLQPMWHGPNRAKSDLVVVGGVTVRGRHLRNLKSTQTKNDNDNAKDIPCLTKSK